MTGRIIDLSRGMNGKQRLTLELDGDFRAMFDKFHDKNLDIKLKIHREKRTLSQNLYYWSLIGKIAAELRISDPHAHNIMLRRYGQIAQYGGQVAYVVLPDTDAAAREADESETFHVRPTSEVKSGKNGEMYRTYILLRGSSEYDTAEMTRLIDGAIREAQELGIDTDTPEEKERLRSLWAQAERSR